MWSTDPKKHWVEWGKRDPYFAVLTADEFRLDRIDENSRKQFFETGEKQIEEALATIKSHFAPQFSPKRTLDFGCGVGRTTLALARRSERAVGLDISVDMLAEAARNAAQANLTNIDWLQSDDQLSRLTGCFDFIFSYIVLHHIRPQLGYRMIERLLATLNPGGAIALHVLYHLDMPPAVRALKWAQAHVPGAHLAINVVRRRALSTPSMESNIYDLPAVLNLLHGAGCREPVLQLVRGETHSHAMIYAAKA